MGFFVAQIKLWPAMREFGQNMAFNISRWEEMWETEVNPSEEDKTKARGRVAKVHANVEDAMNRVHIDPNASTLVGALRFRWSCAVSWAYSFQVRSSAPADQHAKSEHRIIVRGGSFCTDRIN